MPVIVNCTCGKTLKVDEKYRGKRATCPSCGTTLTVVEGPQPEAAATPTPTPKAPAGKSKKTPMPKAAPAPAQDDTNPFAVPPDDSLQKRFTKRSKMPWIIFGCFGILALFLCCGGVGFGLWHKYGDKIMESTKK
jgi:hypothetical protein